MPLAKVKGNFQITLPASIRKQWGITIGDFVTVEDSLEGILIKPVQIVESIRKQPGHEAPGNNKKRRVAHHS
jgi:AbrB family looped-hinge helix DNA binding protein